MSLDTIVVLAALYLGAVSAQATTGEQKNEENTQSHDVQDAFLQWPLPPGAESYAAIDGKHLHQYVVQQVAISRRHRDQVNPQFWGRITGTSSDAESASWLADKFRKAGLSDVRIQSLDLTPQWMPHSWTVSVTRGEKTVELVSAQPFYRSSGTPPEGMDLEAVYLGLGSEADFLGRDVKGKAVFTFSMPGLRDEDALKNADFRGAAALFDVVMLPGNMRYRAYPSGTDAPAFSLGSEDGYRVRDMIARAAGNPEQAWVHVALDVRMTPDLKTALVWGTLPGRTDETIYVMAHRDGWFDAAGDNASGVASMLGLAEHYAKIPQAERRRTIVFIGLDGHHNTGEGSGVGRQWLVHHRDELFSKTAVVINCEHPSTVQTTVRPRYTSGENIVWTNTYTGQQWYAGGPTRPKLQSLAAEAFREFGVSTYLEPNPRPPAGDLGRLYRFVPGVATSDFLHYFHTDEETPETVPWTGLEASTRAYARIIDKVNELDLGELQRPPEPEP